jgi:hypothetical protein
MTLIDVKGIEEKAKKELADEAAKLAVARLKDLYQQRAKAALVVKNLDRQIEDYLAQVSENTTLQTAGVDVSKD